MPRGGNLFAYALAIPVLVAGAYDKFYFTANSTNYACGTSTSNTVQCVPPSICAHDDVINKYYCCNTGDPSNICFSFKDKCGGSDGGPSGGQQPCSSGSNAFCCLNTRERCTETWGQINICWAAAVNPIANLSQALSNKTYSSLSSARPTAQSYSIDVTALMAQATSSRAVSSSTSSRVTSTSASASSSTPSSSTSQPANTDDSSSAVSSGAIAGIVIGAVGGLAFLGAAGFFLWRRRKNSKIPPPHSELDPNSMPYTSNGYKPAPTDAPPMDYYAHQGHFAGGGGGGAYNGPVELFGNGPGGNTPVEVPATRY